MEQLKAFESIQRNFAYAGITANFAHQSRPLNRRISFGFLLLTLDICSVLLFVVYDAEQFVEYTQCANILSAMTIIIFALLALTVRVKRLFEFIAGGNDLVNISELNTKNILCHRVC